MRGVALEVADAHEMLSRKSRVNVISADQGPSSTPIRNEGNRTAGGQEEGTAMAVNQAEANKEIRDQLVSTLESGQAHMPFAEATKAFPTSAINSRLPRVPYSFWHLIEHMRLAQKDMLDYMVSTSYEEPPFPQGYWPGKGTRVTLAQWRQSLAQFHKDREAIIELVRDPARDLFATVPNSAGKHTFFRCCLVIADHNSYHIGELAIGRHVAGLWPKGRKD